ncbi:MAG TPA: hypothetical protein VG148_11205 [Pyrinomonadaceae bacterium]|nr:hypothetical protein [Pyrinomonadaceae bacterium]
MPNVTQTYLGTVSYVSDQSQGGSEFGLSEGSEITVTVTYDSDLVPPTGQYTYETNLGQNGQIQITAGNLSFDAASDVSQTDGWPLIQFNDGQFAGVNTQQDFVNGYLSYNLDFEETDWTIYFSPENTIIANGTLSTPASS